MLKKVADWLLLNLAPLIAAGVIQLLHFFVRIDFCGEENPRSCWDRGESVILSFWHDQLLLMIKGYRGPGAKVLISSSKDGEVLVRTMRYFGQDAVRGSSTRGGAKAFKSLIRLGRESVDLVLTPDGPKGPRHEVKEGVVQLARLTGRPVIPMAFACNRGHRFGSWDRFLLPYPFCRGVFAFGEAVIYEKGEDVEHFRKRLQVAMNENNERARKRLEECGVSAV